MISPNEIKRAASRHFYQWLEGIAERDAPFEPLVIGRIGDKKHADQRWDNLTEIFNASKNKIGYGYSIELEPPRSGSIQQQSKIKAIVFDTEADLMRFGGLEAEFSKFKKALALIRAELPALNQWCIKNGKELIRYDFVWPQLLSVVRFFQENPNPDLPLRLLPINGIDTKFIEQNNKILCALMDALLPPEHIEKQYKTFAKRYRLPEQGPLVECAWNDPALIQYLHGFSRLGFPSDQLATRPLPVSKVIIVENRSSMQQLLRLPLFDTLVVFGGGFGVTLLQHCTWLHEVSLYYWGDLDAHGLAILSQVRGYFPKVVPLMMDEVTWQAHRHLAVTGKPYKGGIPPHLSPEEQAVFEVLTEKTLRVEQEQIRSDWVEECYVFYFSKQP
jgi:hypothetical protein